jgi:hypothetical protein
VASVLETNRLKDQIAFAVSKVEAEEGEISAEDELMKGNER